MPLIIFRRHNFLDGLTTWLLYIGLIKGNGQYKQFVANCIAKIQLHNEIQWRRVLTNDNPADLASRGGQIKQETLWKNGPKWLLNKDKWPKNPVMQSLPTSEAEAKATKEILNVAQTKEDAHKFDRLPHLKPYNNQFLQIFPFFKTLKH